MRRIAAVVFCLALTAGPGCMTFSAHSSTIPAWVGIPASLIAPSSLEAQAWHDQTGGLCGGAGEGLADNLHGCACAADGL